MKAKIIIEFSPGGGTRIVTVQGISDQAQCKSVADQLAILNGTPDDASRGNTVDTFAAVLQSENEIKIQS